MPTIDPDDATWLNDRIGIVIETINGHVTADGRMTATGACLVVLARGEDAFEDAPLPPMGAGPALELALQLLLAAAAIEPEFVAAHLTQLAAENAGFRALLTAPVRGTH